jgi:hypothetical protein
VRCHGNSGGIAVSPTCWLKDAIRWRAGETRGRLGRVLSIAVTILAAGCASKNAPPVTTGSLPPQSYQADSGYRLTQEELTYDCWSLTLLIDQGIPRLKELAADLNKAESASSSSLSPSDFFGNASKPKGAEEKAQYQRERSRLAAYNQALADKRCATVDIDAKLQGVSLPAEPARSTPLFRPAPG